MNNDYNIREDGYIYSTKGKKHRQLKGRNSSSGYLCVGLYINKKMKQFTVHSLVAGKFLGDKPDGMVIDHIDGVKDNNMATNLRYIPQSENIKKAKAYGSVPRDKAIRIKAIKPSMRNRRRLAKVYSVSLQAIMNIVNGKRKL